MSYSSSFYTTPDTVNYRSNSSSSLNENSYSNFRDVSNSFHSGLSESGLMHSYSTSNHMEYMPKYQKAPMIPIEHHKLNVDPNPTIINRKPLERVQQVQNVSLTYLKPPPAPQPGDITIVQEQDIQISAAAPLHITQKPNEIPKPPALLLREKPPAMPAPIPAKKITIPGKVIPPPPRQVIVERLPQEPAKPRDIHIERWLAHKKRVRNVVFKPAMPIVPLPTPKNVIIQWEAPEVDIRQNFKYFGIREADPTQYCHNVEAFNLPKEVSYFKVPAGERLAADLDYCINETPLLVGDVSALKCINLNIHGLSEYSEQVYQY